MRLLLLKGVITMIKPELTDYKRPEKLSEYPQATCYKAGHLVTKNSGWRSKRPVVNTDKCAGCFRCYMYCPDGVIFKKDGKVDIDYDFCKGCGICVKTCPITAIQMEDE